MPPGYPHLIDRLRNAAARAATAAAAVTLAAAGALAASGYSSPFAGPEPPPSIPARSAAAAGAPALATPRAPAVVRDARLGRIASLLAARPIRVDCVSRDELARRTGGIADAWGLAEREQSRMSLLAPFCDFLGAVRGPAPAIPAYHAGPAVLVFAHELQHLLGIADEGEAECRALGAVRATATRGFGVRDQRWLAAMAAAAQRQHERLGPVYRTRC